MSRTSLRRRLLLGLFGYVLLLTVAITIQGMVVNEHAERLVWQTLMEAELDHLIERRREDPGYRWVNSSKLSLYGDQDAESVSTALRALGPGLHDDVFIDGLERVVLVRDNGNKRL